jgi:hypothetical protein
MKKPKEKTIKTSIQKTPAAHPAPGKPKKDKTGNAAKDLYGVHIISAEDIENHFGTSDKKAIGDKRKNEAATDESKIEK